MKSSEAIQGKNAGNYRIGLGEKLGFGSFAMSLDIATNFIATFFLFFLTDVFGISPALAGTVLLLGTIWDAVNDPLIGYYSINRRFKNGEIARPYAKWFALPTALIFILLFTAFNIPMSIRFIYIVVIYLIYDTFSTFLRIPSGSMPTLASGNVKDRIGFSVFSTAGSSIGVIIATLVCWPLINALSGVDEMGGLINPRTGFIGGSALAALVILGGTLFFYANTKERVMPLKDIKDKISTIDALKMLIGSREWVNNTLYMLFYNLSIIFVTASIVYYATYVLNDPGAVTILLGAYIATSLLTLPFVGIIHRKLGRKNLMILAAGILVLSKLYFIFDPANMVAVVMNGALMGIGVAFSIVAFSTNRAEIADLIEWKDGRRIENMISAMSSFISKLGLALGNFIIGLILEITGYRGEFSVQPREAIGAINSFMGTIPMALAALMLIVAFRSKIVEAVSKMMNEKEKMNEESAK